MEPGFERRVFDKNDDPELKWSQAAMNLNVPLSKIKVEHFNVGPTKKPDYAETFIEMQDGCFISDKMNLLRQHFWIICVKLFASQFH